MSAQSNPAQNLCEHEYEREQAENLLPAERIDEAVRLACDAITNIRVNAIGQLADELIFEGYPAGQVYQYIAAKMTADGEPTHWRSIQNWRGFLKNYAAAIKQFPRLPHAAFPLANEIAEQVATSPVYVLQWQDRDSDKALTPYTCEQVKAHFLPPSEGYSAEDWPGILSLVRSAKRYHFDSNPRFVAWLNEGRAIIRELLRP